MSFTEPWQWDPVSQRHERLTVDNDGRVIMETRQPIDGILDSVHEQERKQDPIGLERIASVPMELFNHWASEGYPVFDPDIGNDVVMELLREGHYSRLRTVADKGC